MSIIPERYEVKELVKKLELLGWENGISKGLQPHSCLDSILHDSIFEKKFKDINYQQIKELNLTQSELEELINNIKQLLRNYSEKDILECLKHGIEITIKRERRVFRLIDYENIQNNTFYYAYELKFPGRPENIKPDVTLFVNGIPLVIIEAKASTKVKVDIETDSIEKPIDEAIEQIKRYQIQSPELFKYVQFGVAYADEHLFIPTYPNKTKSKVIINPQSWKVEKVVNNKRIKVEDIYELLKPETLLNVVKWYTFYREDNNKIISRYNQYIASEKVIGRIREYLNSGDKNKGLIWHWQGSGKTYTMFFIANKFFEEYYSRDPVIFFVVDRRDLKKQLIDFIDKIHAPKFKRYFMPIDKIEKLKEVIYDIKKSEISEFTIVRGIYVVLIQLFRTQEFEQILKEIGEIKKKEILLLIDEAHRSQYGLLASMMKKIFPNAIRFAFTGTPVFKYERNTFYEFSYPEENEPYLDVYFIEDSIKDGFTLPIVYEVVKEGDIRIDITEEDIKQFIENWEKVNQESQGTCNIEELFEEETINNYEITKSDIVKYINKFRTILTNAERLKKLAEYIAKRIKEDTENFKFKSMVVLTNRKACVLFKKFFDEALVKEFNDPNAKYWSEIVMTYQQNDTGDILKYKEELIDRFGKTDIDEINSEIQINFKTKDNPKILIVTDMLITGFDAPKLKVMYLDKPLFDHRLLQAIARVNRPYPDKKFGLIVDSVGLLKYVKESLRKYELIAEGEILKDIESNLLENIENEFKNFVSILNELKSELNSLAINGKDFSIDIDKIKELLKENKKEALKYLQGEVEQKLKLVALFWDKYEINKIISKLKEVIQLFKSMGSYKEKVSYIYDIKILTYIYYKILYYIKGKIRKPPKEFWETLDELIYDKTFVEDFEKVCETPIDEQLINILKKLTINKPENLNDDIIADAYSTLLGSLIKVQGLSNPVYKEIFERIEKVRKEWVENRTKFIIELINAIKEKINYDQKIKSKSIVDRIVETIEFLVENKFGKKVSLQKFRSELSNVVVNNNNIHLERIQKPLQKSLFMELCKQLKNIDNQVKKPSPKEIYQFVIDIISNYIVNELKR